MFAMIESMSVMRWMMYPYPFRYVRPQTLDEALRWAETDGMRFLAGGQSLLPLLNLHWAEVAGVIDLKSVGHEFNHVQWKAGEIEFGAWLTHHELATLEPLATRCPLIPRAAVHIGHPRIRRRGTVGGALAHGDPLAEWFLAFLTLNASVVTRSRAYPRRVTPIQEWLLGPLMPNLLPGEIVTGVQVSLPERASYGFLEVSRRAGDYAIMAAGVQLIWDASYHQITGCTLAISGANDLPRTFPLISKAVQGQAPGSELWRFVEDAVQKAVDPYADVLASKDYRRHLAGVLARRVCEQATQQREVLTRTT